MRVGSTSVKNDTQDDEYIGVKLSGILVFYDRELCVFSAVFLLEQSRICKCYKVYCALEVGLETEGIV